ncbi:MAG: hypothetical protein ACYC1C_02160 [Chloroflexota bacterium]
MGGAVGDQESAIRSFVKEYFGFFNLARDKQFQLEAISRIEALKSDLSERKQQAIAELDEETANATLALECLVMAFESELRMWVSFKDADASSAWGHLVDSQDKIRAALQAHSIVRWAEEYTERLSALEALLFPPQMFMSSGMVIRQSRCTICGKEYGECNHVVGKAYMGQICSREITEAEIREVSLVPSPANKMCRILTLSDEGVTRDYLTWRPLPTINSPSNK